MPGAEHDLQQSSRPTGPPEADCDLAPGRLIESIANSPYAVVFRSWGETVNRPVEFTWTSRQRQNAVLPPS